MHRIITGAFFSISLVFAPATGNFLYRNCQGCGVSGTISQEDGTQLELGPGGSFSTGNISGEEPASASGSWDFDIDNPGGFDLQSGSCGPVTPGPGCTGSPCKLVCTNSFQVTLRDKQPIAGTGTTSPTPGPGWGAENNHEWTWSMDKGDIEVIECSNDEETCFDLSINWQHGGAAKTFTFEFCCSQCVDADAADAEPVDGD